MQCAVTADEKWRIRDKLVDVCVLPSLFPLSLLVTLCSVATRFSSDVKITVHTKAEEAKIEEGKQTEEEEDKKCSFEC